MAEFLIKNGYLGTMWCTLWFTVQLIDPCMNIVETNEEDQDQ